MPLPSGLGVHGENELVFFQSKIFLLFKKIIPKSVILPTWKHH
jgi:hypothetical protein